LVAIHGKVWIEEQGFAEVLFGVGECGEGGSEENGQSGPKANKAAWLAGARNLKRCCSLLPGHWIGDKRAGIASGPLLLADGASRVPER